MPTSPSFSATDPQSNAYADHAQEHSYEYEPGLIYLPVASSTTQRPARIRLHGGYGKRTIDWKSVRMNGPPVLPALRLDNDDDTDAVRPSDRVAYSTTTVRLPIPNSDKGTLLFAASGRIVMVQSHDNGPRVMGVDAFPTASYPFSLGNIDNKAEDALHGYQPDLSSTDRESQTVALFLQSSPYLQSRETPWPLTVYPPLFTLNTMFQE